MKSLTPEQQEMMKKMGMGDMQQLMGGAAPASAASAGAAASTAASQGSPASRGAPASSPDPYYSDNVTQMVQRQLKALGYDPGNTDGVDSMETSIAISQFQAENKMKVTGKASPQLAGVLSAKLEGN
jgi:peptidoglycan hydrolase-like protein with peptidoglycan-binding domain